MELSDKLSKIQLEFKSKKSRYNSFGKYYFRSAEDILEALKPFNEKYKVYFKVEESVTVSDYRDGIVLLTSTASIHDAETENSIEATAVVGVDLNQKGMNVPQQFGSASSYAKKYALGNLLLIDDTQDSDATNTHGKDTTSKPQLRKNSDAWQKAIAYLKNGGEISAIQQKYTISTKDLTELSKIK